MNTHASITSISEKHSIIRGCDGMLIETPHNMYECMARPLHWVTSYDGGTYEPQRSYHHSIIGASMLSSSLAPQSSVPRAYLVGVPSSSGHTSHLIQSIRGHPMSNVMMHVILHNHTQHASLSTYLITHSASHLNLTS